MSAMAAPTYMTTMAAPTYVTGTTTMAAAPTYAYAGAQAYETVAAPAVTYAAAPQYETVQYAAAPQYVETMAAPTVQYAAAPQYMETMAAPAVQYAAAPQYMETMAAPQYTYAAAPVTTQVASYVAAPQMIYSQNAYQPTITAPAAPIQPGRLTEGIPTPEQIAQQKNGYSAALDKQLKEAIETVRKETAIEKEMVKFTAEKTIAMYDMQVDEKLIEAQAMADEQSTFALLELNKAKVERNLQLNSQASGLVMDYQMKAVQTELAQKQYAFQQEYMKAENVLAEQYNKQVAQANTGTTYSVAPAAVR